MPPSRRAKSSPAAADLAALSEPTARLRKAPVLDPVLATATAPAPSLAAPAVAPAKVKVGFYQDPADTARARAAFTWTRAQQGHRSFSDFIAHALMREVERLEASYHEGHPWPSMQPGELPTGKPLGT